MTTQEVVAANVRARLAWMRLAQPEAAEAAGCSMRAFTGKLAAKYPFKPNELGKLAELLGLDDPGAFYRVPPDFPTLGPGSACVRIGAGQTTFLLAA